MSKTQIIGLWANLSRAVEIAKTGNHTISVYFDDYEYTTGFDDYETIKEFYKNWFTGFVPDGDIHIGISKPQSYEQNRYCETLENINSRVVKALQFPKPNTRLDSSGEQLLKVGTELLNLSLPQVEKIKEITTTIAQLDNSQNIRVEHIAEAIQYAHKPENYGIMAETKAKMFGGKIQIKPGKIDSESIQDAINYLTNLLS